MGRAAGRGVAIQPQISAPAGWCETQFEQKTFHGQK